MDIQELFQNFVTTTRTKKTSILLVTTSNTVYMKRASKFSLHNDLGTAKIKKIKYKPLDGLPGFARIPKRKINQELKKKLYMTRLGFKPATSCVAIGYSKYLAIDQKEKLIKH